MSVTVQSSGTGSFRRVDWTPSLFNQALVPVPVIAGTFGPQVCMLGNGIGVFIIVGGNFQINVATLALEISLPPQMPPIVTGISTFEESIGHLSVANLLEPCSIAVYDQNAGFPYIEITRSNPPAGGLLQAAAYAGTAFPLLTNLLLTCEIVFSLR